MLNQINRNWTLFLDRDGVINERIPGQYISDPNDLKLTPGCRQAIASFNFLFGRIVVVTNQAGIGKGLMTTEQLGEVHEYIKKELGVFHAKVDQFYFCPEIAAPENQCRKPAVGMGKQAKVDFPEIDFSKSIMVGDSISDMEFGQALGMQCVFIEGKIEEAEQSADLKVAGRYPTLFAFAQSLQENQELG